MNSTPNKSHLERMQEIHTKLLESNPYCYFELAYTKTTAWMVWICSDARENNPHRKVMVNGQGMTAEEACQDALEKYESQEA